MIKLMWTTKMNDAWLLYFELMVPDHKKNFEQTPKKGKHPTLIRAKKIIDKM